MHLEKGDYGEAVTDCDAAVERGRELRADFKLIAKALARKAAALAKAGDLAAAVEAYQKSLTEHRCGILLRFTCSKQAMFGPCSRCGGCCNLGSDVQR